MSRCGGHRIGCGCAAVKSFHRLPDLAAELVRLKVDVIVSVVTQASVAAKGATDTIPIVMAAVSDPLGRD